MNIMHKNKNEKVNVLLAHLPFFTPYGWKCAGAVLFFILIVKISIS